LTADIFNGAVISVEHLVMVILGGAGASILASRLTKLRIQVNGRLSSMENRLEDLEAKESEVADFLTHPKDPS
jgi:hypothetical protein